MVIWRIRNLDTIFWGRYAINLYSEKKCATTKFVVLAHIGWLDFSSCCLCFPMMNSRLGCGSRKFSHELWFVATSLLWILSSKSTFLFDLFWNLIVYSSPISFPPFDLVTLPLSRDRCYRPLFIVYLSYISVCFACESNQMGASTLFTGWISH